MPEDRFSFAFLFVFCFYVSVRMQIIKASWHFDLSSGCVLKLHLNTCGSEYRFTTQNKIFLVS